MTFIQASNAAEDEIWLDPLASYVIVQLVVFIEHKLLLYGNNAMVLFQICLVISIDRKFQDLVSRMKAGPSESQKTCFQDYNGLHD